MGLDARIWEKSVDSAERSKDHILGYSSILRWRKGQSSKGDWEEVATEYEVIGSP